MGWKWNEGDKIEIAEWSCSTDLVPEWRRGVIVDTEIKGMPDHVVVRVYIGAAGTTGEIVEKALLFPAGHHERVNVGYAQHTVPASVVGQGCALCRLPATHKIGDESGPSNFHNLTNWVCCTDMKALGMDCALYPQF